jgi:hypothetical protein
MTPIFPVIELFDRWVIAEIKFERTNSNTEELYWYRAQISHYNLEVVQDLLNDMKNIHNAIWNLEADLKSFQEHRHSLEEIGRRAIEIRNLNHQRIKIKNTLAERLSCIVREIKMDHLSQ